jgi:hypothetical protein
LKKVRNLIFGDFLKKLKYWKVQELRSWEIENLRNWRIVEILKYLD